MKQKKTKLGINKKKFSYVPLPNLFCHAQLFLIPKRYKKKFCAKNALKTKQNQMYKNNFFFSRACYSGERNNRKNILFARPHSTPKGARNRKKLQKK